MNYTATGRGVSQPMIEITLQYVYGLAEAYEPLERLKPDTPLGDAIVPLWRAQAQLEGLLTGSVFASSIRSSRPQAGALLTAIKSALESGGSPDEGLDRVLVASDILPINYNFGQFKTAFLAELATLPAYFVNQKGGYDTLALLHQAFRLFPEGMDAKAPEAMFDVAQAARALAFSMPTSSGFHAFRATEAVLRRYYSEVTGGKAPPKIRNIAVYIAAMRKAKCGDEKILSVLSQMSSLHRNPLIHPEVVLTQDEAVGTLGMARSAIGEMLTELPEIPQTTTTVSSGSGTTIATRGT